MARRGRPPYPDILTPREWEVLALLREGLTNEAIAARLDITAATAKYHVSEILSKLGVATREDAAAWSAEPASARRWALVPRIALATAATAALAGLAVLGWSVLFETTEHSAAIIPGWPDCPAVDAASLDAGLHVLDGRTCLVRSLIDNEISSLPVWDAEGRRLAFAQRNSLSDPQASTDIYVVDVFDRSIRRVTDTPQLWENSPVWTADGALLFSAWSPARARANTRFTFPGRIKRRTRGGHHTCATGWRPEARRRAAHLFWWVRRLTERRAARRRGWLPARSGASADHHRDWDQSVIMKLAHSAAWAPHKDSLAYECPTADELDIDNLAICVWPEGNDAYIVTGPDGEFINAGQPVWSRDGTTLAFKGWSASRLYLVPQSPRGEGSFIDNWTHWTAGDLEWLSGDIAALRRCTQQNIAPCPTIHLVSQRISDRSERIVMNTSDCGASSAWSGDGQMLAIGVPLGTACY